jgi:hypothetical protein
MADLSVNPLWIEWTKRPAEQKHMSFQEWKEERERPAMAAAVERIAPTAARPRHEAGKMNKLEGKYAAHLELRKTAGEISDWRFEPMKLRLAPSTFFDIDFLVRFDFLLEDGREVAFVELHELKGHWEDDARVKMKVAATMFPLWTFRGVQWDKTAKDWKFEEFKA